MGRRIRAVRNCIAGPRDLWLALRMLSWTPILPLLKYVLPLPLLVRLMWTPPRGSPAGEVRCRQVSEIARLLYRSRGLTRRDNCLERSLVTYRFLAGLRADPVLVVGMSRGEADRGHVWVTVDGRPVNETDASLAHYVPVVAFGSRGERRAASEPR